MVSYIIFILARPTMTFMEGEYNTIMCNHSFSFSLIKYKETRYFNVGKS